MSPAKQAEEARAQYRWAASEAARANDRAAARIALDRFVEILRRLGLKDAS